MSGCCFYIAEKGRKADKKYNPDCHFGYSRLRLLRIIYYFGYRAVYKVSCLYKSVVNLFVFLTELRCLAA